MKWRLLKTAGIIFGIAIISSVSYREENINYKKENEIMFNESVKLSDKAIEILLFADSLQKRCILLSAENKALKTAYFKSEHKRIYGD